MSQNIWQRFLSRAVALMGALLLVIAQPSPTWAAITNVRISNVQSVAFTVSWVTDTVTDGEIHYGTNPASLSLVGEDDRGIATTDDTHHVTISSGLLPNTTYYFDVVSGVETDNNGGAHYTITTGPDLGIPPFPDTIFGQVFHADGTTPANGTLVYITLEDGDGVGSNGQGALLSSLVDSGFWFVNLASARTPDLAALFTYSASGDRVLLSAQGAAEGVAQQTVDTNNDTPAPDMILSPPLLVTLDSFGATRHDGGVELDWTTTSEINNLGFTLYRSSSEAALGDLLTPHLIPSQAPGSGQGASYTWLDSSAAGNQGYYYTLADQDQNGTVTHHGPVYVAPIAPTALTLSGFENHRTAPISAALALTSTLALVGLALRRGRHQP